MIDYNKLISPGIQALAPSGIRKFFDIAAEMKDAGIVTEKVSPMLLPHYTQVNFLNP